MKYPAISSTHEKKGLHQNIFFSYSLLIALIVFAACNDDPAGPVSPSTPDSDAGTVLPKGESSIDVTDRYIVL